MDNIAQVSQQAIAALSQIAALQHRVERLEVVVQGFSTPPEPRPSVSVGVVLVRGSRLFLWTNEHLAMVGDGDSYRLQAESQGIPVEVIFQGDHDECLDLLSAIHTARQVELPYTLDVCKWVRDRSHAACSSGIEP